LLLLYPASELVKQQNDGNGEEQAQHLLQLWANQVKQRSSRILKLTPNFPAHNKTLRCQGFLVCAQFGPRPRACTQAVHSGNQAVLERAELKQCLLQLYRCLSHLSEQAGFRSHAKQPWSPLLRTPNLFKSYEDPWP